nr:hypothetical protein CFP56_50662 [Quercus suber]
MEKMQVRFEVGLRRWRSWSLKASLKIFEGIRFLRREDNFLYFFEKRFLKIELERGGNLSPLSDCLNRHR